MVKNAITSAANLAVAQSGLEGKAPGQKDDFIMRPGGGATNFSKDDTIIGVKDPSKLLGGGGGVTNVFNITVNDTDLERRIAQAIEKVNAKNSRYGFYQKGY